MTESKEGQKRHSGSQKRQRHRGVYVACTPEEKAAIFEKAQANGLSAGGYLRMCALNRVTPGTKRRAPVDLAMLGKAMAELRHVGNNINQIARSTNMNEPADSERLHQALSEYMATLRQLREASGR